MKEITEIAKKCNLENNIISYGKYMAKIDYDYTLSDRKNSKLILVTSINPTPFGEGKTTLSIGINDSLNKLGLKSVACLREPSLGPVFGRKGGAIGGGKSIICPKEDINLHFTGDMHAITSANNMICAIIDNHIYQGNELDIQKVAIKRCLDINDRSLRKDFVITPASQIMAILCLSKSLDDLKERIGKIIAGYNSDNNPIYIKDLHAEEAITILLKDAIKPNLVQSLYNNPVIVHGGPFANIAHGCSSIIATKTGMSLFDYVITEAGFGSDLGAIKFFDIKCKNNDIYPEAVILNCTINALKYNGNGILEDGICNLEFHINNMKKYTDNLLVAINVFDTDTKEEINFIKKFCKKRNIEIYECTMFKNGEDGCLEISKRISELSKNNKRYHMYEKTDSIYDKIMKICINEYGAKKVNISDELLKIINNLDSNLDVCISKTPMSITDNANKLGYPKNFELTVTDIQINNGANFVTILLGNILTMPGLTKESKYLNMKIDKNNIISGV